MLNRVRKRERTVDVCRDGLKTVTVREREGEKEREWDERKRETGRIRDMREI